MNIKRYISTFLLILSCLGCFVPKRVLKEFTYCFDNQNTGLDSLLDVGGIYYLGKDLIQNKSRDYIFYKNGFSRTGSYEHWLKDSLKGSKYGHFGSYRLSNDTIKVQFISSPDGMSCGKYDIWFKIVDKQTIEMIYKGNSNTITQEDVESFKSNDFYKERGTIFKLYPLKELPTINETYIINKKWFWCNEEAYKEWKKYTNN